MRRTVKDFELGSVAIEDIEIDTKSRDDTPAILLGLQAIYVDPSTRERLFALLRERVAPKVSHATGRPGMPLWNIAVLGVLKTGLDCDWDRLEWMANKDLGVREMLGIGLFDEGYKFERQTLIDNVGLLTPELLREINALVVEMGHEVARKKPGEPLRGRVDSFVGETDVRHPTDVGLLRDAVRAAVRETERLCDAHGLPGWRQHKHLLRELRESHGRVRRKKGWTRPPLVREYLGLCRRLRRRMGESRQSLPDDASTGRLDHMLEMADRLLDQVDRRLLKGQSVPHDEKVFSVFEPHTRWIAKGKAKAPVELGVPVTILEDHHGFVLGSRIQWEGGDVDAAEPLVREVLERYPELAACSFDRGFHSPRNRQLLDSLLELDALPRKGYLNAEERVRESDPEFREMRRLHAGVESAIHHLEHHGLDRVRAHGAAGFERTVELSILAANLHRLGMYLRDAARRAQRRRRREVDKRRLPRAA